MKTACCAVTTLLLCLACSILFADPPHPLQVEDLQKMSRISEVQLSPDGKWIVFTVQRSDIPANKNYRNLWMVSSTGGQPAQLTFATGGSNSRPRWAPDSRSVYFLSTRVNETAQIFRLSLAGGEARQITKFTLGIDSYTLSPDGKTIAFVSAVFPECRDVACNEKKKKQVDENPVKALVITESPFRRWDAWIEGKRNHIFVMPADGGEARDMTPGDIDSPIWSEAGGEEVAFSPDSQELCFTRYTESEAWTGNSDLYTMPVSGEAPPRQITTNKAGDSTPLYSPDGQSIAYSAYLRPGLETDVQRLFLYNRKTGEQTNLTEQLDRPTSSYVWTPDSKALWITIEDRGQVPILKIDTTGKTVTPPLYSDGTHADVQISADSRFLVYTRTDFAHPAEIFRVNLLASKKPFTLTGMNAELLSGIAMGDYRSFEFPGWNGETVQSWEIRPPSFDPQKKYPLLLLMHGGPESSWENLFHYRWNAELFSAAGYVVIMPNFHGSTGFGLKFMDAIKGRWGSAPYEDQMKAVDFAIQQWPYVDATRTAAAGASYGGYMANWVESQTDRFRTIVNHDGLFDLLTSLYSSDFPGGLDKEFLATAWQNQEELLKWAPSTYAKNFKTPMLIIHGMRDYRIDACQAFATFQVLQAMGVPSKLIVLPNENHFVLQPADSIFWYHTVLDWLAQWVRPDEAEYRKMLKR